MLLGIGLTHPSDLLVTRVNVAEVEIALSPNRAASALLFLNASMQFLELSRELIDTILRDAMWLLLRCRESCDAS